LVVCNFFSSNFEVHSKNMQLCKAVKRRPLKLEQRYVVGLERTVLYIDPVKMMQIGL